MHILDTCLHCASYFCLNDRPAKPEDGKTGSLCDKSFQRRGCASGLTTAPPPDSGTLLTPQVHLSEDMLCSIFDSSQGILFLQKDLAGEVYKISSTESMFPSCFPVSTPPDIHLKNV